MLFGKALVVLHISWTKKNVYRRDCIWILSRKQGVQSKHLPKAGEKFICGGGGGGAEGEVRKIGGGGWGENSGEKGLP